MTATGLRIRTARRCGSPLRQRWLDVSLLAAVAVLAGCDGGSSPTDATPTGSSLSIVFESDAEALRPLEAIIRARIEESHRAASARIPVDGVVVAVNTSPLRIIGGWGVGGFAPGGFRIEISIDPALSEALLDDRLPSMVAHELHHAARIRGPGYGTTLLEAMVSEGLADQFAAELLGRPLPPWVEALDESEIARWLATARVLFDSPAYDHAGWFFGSTAAIPRWTGYTLGMRLVVDYQQRNGDPSAASLVNASAELFRPD